MGAVMGGTYFMLADFTFAVAANWKKWGVYRCTQTSLSWELPRESS
jgi:hypothetical protein